MLQMKKLGDYGFLSIYKIDRKSLFDFIEGRQLSRHRMRTSVQLLKVSSSHRTFLEEDLQHETSYGSHSSYTYMSLIASLIAFACSILQYLAPSGSLIVTLNVLCYRVFRWLGWLMWASRKWPSRLGVCQELRVLTLMEQINLVMEKVKDTMKNNCESGGDDRGRGVKD